MVRRLISRAGGGYLTEYSAIMMGLFLFTAVVGVGATRLSIFLSHRLEILDAPDPRKSHREPVAYLGGLGILLAFAVGLLGLVLLQPDFAVLRAPFFTVVLLGALAIFLIGFWDDVRPIAAIPKLLLQIAVASGMWLAGVRVEMLSLGGAPAQLGLTFSYIITVGWYVTLMNSINLVDGLDGLAGGISLISAISLVGVSLVIGVTPEVVIGAFLSLLTAGAVLGFLVYNWNPAKTFMGDSGSLLLGYLLATASLVGSTKTPTLMALSVPLVALGLPLFETFFSFLRRAVSGQHPFKPDRRHLHHRLLDMGLDQRRVVVILLFMTGFLGVNSVILAQVESRLIFFNVLFLVGGLILLIENLKFLERKRGQSAENVVVQDARPVKEKQLL